jgi:hypothetical protein
MNPVPKSVQIRPVPARPKVPFKEHLRHVLRQQPLWLQLHAYKFYGARWTWNRLVWPRKVLATPPVPTDPVLDTQQPHVQIICCGSDWDYAVWALKSFYRFSGVAFPLTIHLQGRIAPRTVAELQWHFPNAWVVQAEEASKRVLRHLCDAGLPWLVNMRHSAGIMWKLTDLLVLAGAPKVLALDPDVIFFRRPDALLAELAGDLSSPVFMRDCQDAYLLPRVQLRDLLGVEVAPALNTGLVARRTDAWDLDLVERLLRPMLSVESAGEMGLIEQTLIAAAASASGPVKLWPEDYVINLTGRLDPDRITCRHYCGPSKPMVMTEAMRHLHRRGFLD